MRLVLFDLFDNGFERRGSSGASAIALSLAEIRSLVGLSSAAKYFDAVFASLTGRAKIT
jgi:hypothetical protein